MAAAVGCLIKKTSKGYIEGLRVIIGALYSIIDFIFNGKSADWAFCVASVGISIMALETYLLLGYAKIVSLTLVNSIIMAFIWFGIPMLMIPIYNAVFYCIVDEDKRIIQSEGGV